MSDPARERLVTRVAAARLVRFTGLRLTEGWRSLPAPARREWLTIVGVGLALSLAVVAVLTILGERAATAGDLAWEAGIMRWAQSGHRAMSVHQAVWVDALGSSAMLIPLVVLGTTLAAARGRPLTALSFLVGFVGAKALIFLGWTMWNRVRPSATEGGLIVPEGLPSYPSGHMVQTVVIYGLLAYLWSASSRSTIERIVAWLLVLAIATLTALARLRIGAHWPADVIVGGGFGLLWLGVLIVALRRAQARESNGAAGPPARVVNAEAGSRAVSTMR